VALLAAVTRPERVMGLVIYNSPARFLNAADYPIGLPPEVAGMMESADPAVWKEFIAVANPSRASDQSYLRRMQRLMRSVAGPSAVSAYGSEMVNRDVRSLLPAVHVPTLILHRANNLVFPPELAQYLADRIEGAKLVMIEGSDMSPFYERPEVFIEKVREFLHEVGPTDGPLAAPDRVMATILFTDITASTELAQRRGDSEWMHLLEMHDSMSHRSVEAQLGRVIKTTGDGIMARFDSPGRGIVSAIALRSELGRIALPIRAGLHTGEVELREDDLGGVAVHIAARVLAAAGPGEILVSQTIKDLVVGSDFRFADRGRHQLKGIEGDWQLFALAD
jgi:class 3 adenylate cyclase